MKALGLFVFTLPILAVPAPQTGATTIDSSLIPDFGVTPGIPSASQPGSCEGANGVNIPCLCPPDVTDFVQRLDQFSSAGNVFDTVLNFSNDVNDMSLQTQLNRIDACIITLQNFDNTIKGAGCPVASAPNFIAIQDSLLQQIQNEQSA